MRAIAKRQESRLPPVQGRISQRARYDIGFTYVTRERSGHDIFLRNLNKYNMMELSFSLPSPSLFLFTNLNIEKDESNCSLDIGLGILYF